MIQQRIGACVMAISLLWPSAAAAELRRVELKTIGMD
jgi:hypothetical protein